MEEVNNKRQGLEFSSAFEVREVGKIKSVQKFIVLALGLPSCVSGQMVEFSNGVKGLVIGFTEEEVQILVLGSAVDLKAGDEAYNKGEFLKLPVGKNFLGRIVNSLCEPQDGKGPIEPDDFYPVFRDVPGVMDRIPVDQTLETGTLSIDAIIPIAKGQRQLLIGDRLTGKTTVAVDAIISQKGKDVNCIYCCIGKTYSNLLKIVDILRDKGALDYTIIVSGIASTSVGEQYLAPYTAAMLGEYFMYNGKDALVIFDDLTRHAWVYRQISLLLGRAPGREAYPGDIFYIHSQLMERAGYLKPELGKGSMTFFPIVEIQQGDVTGYISTNIISMTDGQLYFSTPLFNKGFRPAIDLGLSVSRIGSKAQWPAMRAFSRTLRLEYLQYKELLQMTQLRATGLSKEAEASLKRGEAITQLLIQDKNQPVEMERQILWLFALNLGVLDNLSVAEIKKFKETFLEKVKEQEPEIISELRERKELTKEIAEKLRKCLQRYFEEV
ncbi:MAG: F0F1 ATP synthase subunit alpha [Candidatus Omnitrophota bacterium]|nr:MAG: F0F1 ATP synthase subunit alpha [Candidatus Omnitrophota bacterium]